jgi:hypothetical protein
MHRMLHLPSTCHEAFVDITDFMLGMRCVFNEPSLFDHERDLCSENHPNVRCDALSRVLNFQQAERLLWIFS